MVYNCRVIASLRCNRELLQSMPAAAAAAVDDVTADYGTDCDDGCEVVVVTRVCETPIETDA